MIDCQSSCLVTPPSRRSVSPEGCGRLARDNIPGNPSLYPRALKGRWKQSIPFVASSSLSFSASDLHCLGSIRSILSVFISVHPWLNSLFQVSATINSQPKSTSDYSKSTVDLGLEPLIWGKNGLQTSLLPGLRPSFYPIETMELWDAGQIQTDSDQKINQLERAT